MFKKSVTILVEPEEVHFRKENYNSTTKIKKKWSGSISVRKYKEIDIFAAQFQRYSDAKVSVVEDYLQNAPEADFILYQASKWPLNSDQFEDILAGCDPDIQSNLLKRLVLLNAEYEIFKRYSVAATISENDYEFGGATLPNTDRFDRAGSFTGHTDVARSMGFLGAEEEKLVSFIVGKPGETLPFVLVKYLLTYAKFYGL